MDSYEQFHRTFGGTKTGDRKDSKTGWCHANGVRTYDNWMKNGRYALLVLFDRDWLGTKPRFESIDDEYGRSAIALLVDRKTGDLVNNTFRYNHLMKPVEGSVDNVVEGYADLSEIAGFDVGKRAKELVGAAPRSAYER